MFHDSTTRFVPNPLFVDENQGYSRNKKVKGKIKVKNDTSVLKDCGNIITNKNIKKTQQQKPNILCLEIDESQGEDEAQQVVLQDQSKEQNEKKEKQEQSKEVQKHKLIPKKLIQVKKQLNTEKIKTQSKDKQNEAKIQQKSSEKKKDQILTNAKQKKKNIFNIDFGQLEDSNSEENTQSQSQQKQAKQKQNDVQEQRDLWLRQKNGLKKQQQFTNFKPNHCKEEQLIVQKPLTINKMFKNIFNFQYEDSEQSNQSINQSESVIVKITPRNQSINQKSSKSIEKQNPKLKKFLLKFQEDQQQSSSHNSVKDEHSQQEDFNIIQKINIFKFKSMSPFYNIQQSNMTFLQKYHYLISQAVSDDYLLPLMIKRNQDTNEYIAYDNQLVRQVIGVKKQSGNYIFYLKQKQPGHDTHKNKGKNIQLVKMKSNFLGTQFHCYLLQKNNSSKKKKYLVSIIYETNILGLNGPRKISMYIPCNKSYMESQKNLSQLYQQSNYKQDSGIIKLINKTPKWSSQIMAYVLDFHGRATKSSVKNCIMTQVQNTQKQRLLFGKISKDIFNLDIKSGLTVIQSMALAVSSFQRKLGCQ